VLALSIIGNKLFAIGDFTVGGQQCSCASFNGASWTALELAATTFTAMVAVGSDLFVAGFFDTVGGNVSANNIARYSGTTFSPLGAGVDSAVAAMAVSGNQTWLYVA
jgi:hypothetical protein